MAGTSARRYAQAVFQIALERDELDRWLEELGLMANALQNSELSSLLNAPQVPLNIKQKVINETLQDVVGLLALNLMALLASRSLAGLVMDIADQYQMLLDAHRGIEQAEVVSAVPLSNGQLKKAEEMLKTMIAKDIKLGTRVEPDIIGGLIVRIGDQVMDASTAAKLRNMRKNLVERQG